MAIKLRIDTAANKGDLIAAELVTAAAERGWQQRRKDNGTKCR